MAKDQQEPTTIIPAPIRGYNADEPLSKLRSGELHWASNVNLVRYNGALGTRACFAASGTAAPTGKLQAIKDWVDEDGNAYVVIKMAGATSLYQWQPGGTLTAVGGTVSADQIGNIFVLGCDLYYVDTANLWHHDAKGSTTHSDSWTVGACSGRPTATYGADATPAVTGGMDQGYFRYCLVPYDSKRRCEGRRSEYSAAVAIPDDTCNAVKLTWTSGIRPSAGRYDKLRIYRTAEDTDFRDRGGASTDPAYGSSYSSLGVLVAEVAKTDTSWVDRKGKYDCDWEIATHDQAGEQPPKCRLAVQYGNVILFFGTTNAPGGFERSVSNKLVQVGRPWAMDEPYQGGAGAETDKKLRYPHIDYGGGVCPIPMTHTAVIDHQGQTLIFTRSGIYRVTGSPDSPYASQLEGNHGCPGRWAMAPTPYGIVFWDGATLCRLAGAHVEPFPVKGVSSILNSIAAANCDSVCVGYCTRTNELLVAYKVSTTWYMLAFDFQRSAWFKYLTDFTDVYGFFETYSTSTGKQMYCMAEKTASDGFYAYPSSSGETITDVEAAIVLGTENLGLYKSVQAVRLTIGATALTMSLKGYWSGEDSSNVSTVVAAPTNTNDSVLIEKWSHGQVKGRFFTMKIAGTDSTTWSLIGIDQFDMKGEPLNP